MHIQVCHFATADALLVLFVTAALHSFIQVADRGSLWNYLCSAVITALVLATDPVLLPILLVFVGAFLLSLITENRFRTIKPYLGLALFLATFFVTLFVTHPFAFLQNLPVSIGERAPGFSALWATVAPRLRILGSTDFWAGIRERVDWLSGLPSNATTLPYLRTFPYLYPAANLCRWCLGWPLGLAVIAGLFYFTGKHLYGWDRSSLVLLGWTLPYLAITGRMTVKQPGTLMPVLPCLCLFAAVLLSDLIRLLGFSDERRPASVQMADLLGIRTLSRRFCLWLGTFGLLGMLLVVCFSAYYSLQFVEIYRQPHTWMKASAWIYQNVPTEKKIVCEQLDQPLPRDIAEHSADKFAYLINPVYDEPDWDTNKISLLAENLLKGDYLVLGSKRSYAAMLRLPSRFP
ncbi:MAG TPA: hypothetical protein PKH07_18750, partial [bacterium]|nr:hypothetical protein [bacterium]